MVNLTHENDLLQEINNLSVSGKIQDSITTQGGGSGLTAQQAESKIQKLIPTTRQRLGATKFYLDVMENMNYAPYLESQSSFSEEEKSLSEEEKSLIDFSDSNLHVQINFLNPEPFPLIVFLLLQGFFSNLVSLEDCIMKIINIAYDLIRSDERPSDIRKALDKKTPNGNLISYLCTFHAISQDGKLDKTGSPFNIAKKIRNRLVHDEIAEVLFPPLPPSGFPLDPNLYFNKSFFPVGTVSKHTDTEMITFCEKVYESTVNFVDECYRLIHADLKQEGKLPV